MGKPQVTIGEEPDGKAAVPDTFAHTLSNGSVIVAGKAAGVLKLRLLRLLPEEFRNDLQMQGIATAFCGVRTFDGHPPVLTNPVTFEAFLQRFGSDEDVDEYVSAYNRFVDPDGIAMFEKAISEGQKQGLTGDKLMAFVQDEVVKERKRRLKKVRD